MIYDPYVLKIKMVYWGRCLVQELWKHYELRCMSSSPKVQVMAQTFRHFHDGEACFWFCASTFGLVVGKPAGGRPVSVSLPFKIYTLYINQ